MSHDNISSGWFVTLGLFIVLSVGAFFYYDPLDSRTSGEPIVVTEADTRKLEKIKAACEAKWGGIFPVKNRDGTIDYLLRGNGFTSNGNKTEHLILRFSIKADVEDYWETRLDTSTTMDGETEIVCDGRRNQQLSFYFDAASSNVLESDSIADRSNFYEVVLFSGSVTNDHWQNSLKSSFEVGSAKNCVKVPGTTKHLFYILPNNNASEAPLQNGEFDRRNIPCTARKDSPGFYLSTDTGQFLAFGTCHKAKCRSRFRGPNGGDVDIYHRQDEFENIPHVIKTLSTFLQKNTVYFGTAK